MRKHFTAEILNSVLTINDGLSEQSDLIQRAISLGKRYPDLYHYVREASLKTLLESKGLLACPTWQFRDAEEYVLGLKIVREELLSARKTERERVALAGRLFDLYGDARPPVVPLLDRVIDMITMEVKNSSSPSVQVYVASLTTDGGSERMARAYGPLVLGFAFELPSIAYHAPEPFTSSKLSRVTYDEIEFRTVVLDLMFSPCEDDHDLRSQRDWLREQSASVRIDAVAAWCIEAGCLLAPNLKRPEFKFEREWRLESAISAHAASVAFPRRSRQSMTPHLPRDAELRDTGKGPRYLQQLLSLDRGKMIVRSIAALGSVVDSGLQAWIESWSAANSSPLTMRWSEVEPLYAASKLAGR